MHTTTLQVMRYVNLDHLCIGQDSDFLAKIVFPAGLLQPPFFSLEWYVVVAATTVFSDSHAGQDIYHMVHLAWLPPTNLRLV